MNIIQLALSAVVFASSVACGVDDASDRDVVDPDDAIAANGLVADVDVVVAGVVVRFVNEGDPALDLDGCVDTGRCSVRFGDVVAEIGDATVTPREVIAVVPAGVVSGPACLTLDGVERCVAIDVVDAPIVAEVTTRTENCICRCVGPTYTVLELQGAAFPVDATVELDGETMTTIVDDSEHVQAWSTILVTPGAHTLTVRAPLHGDAESEAFEFLVVADDAP